LIFTVAELASLDVESTLENLTPDCNGRTVHDVIDIISQKLTARLMNPSASESEDKFLSDDDDDDLDDLEGFDWELGIHPPSDAESTNLISTQMPRTVRERLRRDLNATRSAGIRVGLLKLNTSQVADTISLSIRASKLGILEETLEAWGLQASDYLVLLLHYPKGYPSISEFLKSAPKQSDLRLHFGKCAAPKPSMKSAKWAFSDPTSRKLRATEKETTDSELHDCKDDFHHLHMSTAIDSLLNEQLSALISLRRSYSVSWDNAQNLLFQTSRDLSVGRKDLDEMHSEQNAESDEEHIITKAAPKGLHHDLAMDSEETFNVSLVCMQFALRRFAKCTKYCMVCHQKMQGNFEAVKPYVCSDSLCLYQYLSLGLGTTIEHEIISSPHVVDLLISFFYAAINQKRVREFPRGLGLKAFSTGTLKEPNHHFKVDAYFPERILRFGGSSQEIKPFLREGKIFLLIVSSIGSVSTEHTIDYGKYHPLIHPWCYDCVVMHVKG
jgi:ubiquitin-conjugating enzyme E2 Q